MPRPYELTPQEREALESYEEKLRLIRDLVRSVASRLQSAVYLSGPSGIGKTYTARKGLEDFGRQTVYRNARVTAAGLFELFAQHADDVIVLDDVANLFRDRISLQYLQAALDSDGPRVISRTVHGQDQQVAFTGGLIAISNLPLAEDPIARSIQSRAVHHEFDVTDAEIAAFMKHLVLEGKADTRGLSPDDSLMVVEFLIEEGKNRTRRLDLRHLGKSFGFFKQWREGQSETDWRDLVRVVLEKPILRSPRTKQEELHEQRTFIQALLSRFPGDSERQVEAFSAQFGMAKSTFYKRKREVESRIQGIPSPEQHLQTAESSRYRQGERETIPNLIGTD